MHRSPALVRDAYLPAALFVLATAELALSDFAAWGWGVACQSLACALLIARRRAPLLVAPLAAWALLPAELIEPELSEAAAPIAVIVVASYSCARYRADLWGIAAVGLMLTSAVPRYAFVDTTNDITDLFFVGALVVPPFVFGRVARHLEDQTKLLQQQARLLEERQDALRREEVRAERTRIARDLHDVIAHSVSAMVVQTAAAQDLVRSDPDRADRALSDVAATGRRTLAEIGQLLHLVRDDADELGLAPVPGVAQLDELVVGDDVALHQVGDLQGLPSAVDASAYRIVQEALTNARRYGDGAISVSVVREQDAVRIRATNRVTSLSSQGGGLGLVGMAERAAVLGGSLTHGVRDGRFELEAVLPVGGQ